MTGDVVPGGGDGLPVDAAARALRRAVDRRAEPGDVVPLEELLAVGREIGLEEADVRAAVAVERAGGDDPPEAGWRARLAGPRTAGATVVVAEDAGRVAARADEWLRTVHCMREVARDGDEAVWVPAEGMLAGVRRGIATAAGASPVHGVRFVRRRVGSAGDRVSALRVEADAGSREHTEAAAVGIAGAGVVGAAVLVAVAGPLGVILVPLGAVIGGTVLAARRRRMAEAQAAVTAVAGAVRRGEAPPRARDVLLPAVRRRAAS